MEHKIKSVSELLDRLFALMTLGDDRTIKATYIMGELKYERD